MNLVAAQNVYSKLAYQRTGIMQARSLAIWTCPSKVLRPNLSQAQPSHGSGPCERCLKSASTAWMVLLGA